MNRWTTWGASLVLVGAVACDDGGGEVPLTDGSDATMDASADASGEVFSDTVPSDTAPSDAAPSDAVPTDPGPDGVERTGLGLDHASLEPGAAPRWEPQGSGWFAVPWPNDMRRLPGGAPDLSIVPNPSNEDLLTAYLAHGEEVLDGFGLNGGVYFELGGAVDFASLPTPREAMEDPAATVQLVNATPESPRYGERRPLRFRAYGDGDPYMEPDTLALRPVFGFPLTEGETWCAVLTRGVLDGTGRHLSPADGFPEAIGEEPSLAPLEAWLPDSGLIAEDVAAATCFTTGRPTRELREVRDFLDGEPPVEIVELSYEGSTKRFEEFRGVYLAPNFQAGDKPYQDAGGDIRFDAGGQPVVQLDEPIRFVLMIPRSPAFQMSQDGWPLVLYGHGTGGDYETCKRGSSVGDRLLREGVAMICIDQPLHGARGSDDWGLSVELLSFNFFNPRAGRSNFRQSAIDVMSLSRSVAAGAFDMAEDTTGFGDEVRFDPERVSVFGHSHGGLAGAIALGVDPTLHSGVLSGAGGLFLETILRRKDIVNFEQIVRDLLRVPEETFDTFHPALSIVQMLVDATDPINYAPYWLAPAPGGRAKHVFVTEGTEDEATPYVTTNYMAGAAGVPLIAPVAVDSPVHDLRDLPVIEALPIVHNVEIPGGGKRTAGLRQWDGGDHWVAFEPAAQAMWRSFFKALRTGGDPVIDDTL